MCLLQPPAPTTTASATSRAARLKGRQAAHPPAPTCPHLRCQHSHLPRQQQQPLQPGLVQLEGNRVRASVTTPRRSSSTGTCRRCREAQPHPHHPLDGAVEAWGILRAVPAMLLATATSCCWTAPWGWMMTCWRVLRTSGPQRLTAVTPAILCSQSHWAGDPQTTLGMMWANW